MMDRVAAHPGKWPLCEGPLPFKTMTMCQKDYREFVCSVATFEWLRDGGMTHLDEMPVTLQIMDTILGGHNVIVKIWVDAPTTDHIWVMPDGEPVYAPDAISLPDKAGNASA